MIGFVAPDSFSITVMIHSHLVVVAGPLSCALN